VNKILKLFPQLESIRLEVVNYHDSLSNKGSLWELEEKGFLFKLFQNRKSNGNHLAVFFNKVELVIDARRQLISSCKNSIENTDGNFLLFDPSSTMYDGLSEEVSSGFFDPDDVPPPEFWIGIVDEQLVSFIPSEYFELANSGVDSCMSGCLEWCNN